MEPALVDALVAAVKQLDDPGCYINLLDRLIKQPNYCYSPRQDD